MLYATTSNNAAVHPAQRALTEDTAPDGGLYIPGALPVYDRKSLEELLSQEPCEIMARILNAFFDTSLGRFEVEFAVGRRLFGLVGSNYRIVIGELWRNSEWSVEGLCRRLTDRLCAGTGSRPGLWMRIACRIGLAFGVFAKLRSLGAIEPGETVDAAVLTGDFESTYALWTARKMGLPLGQIVCCCNENGGVWDLINRGQMKLGSKPAATLTVPPALELMLWDLLDRKGMDQFHTLRQRGGTLYLNAEQQRRLRQVLSASVIGVSRVERDISNLYHTNGYILCPRSALVYGGLMDHRSRPGPRRTALMLTESDPRESGEAVCRILGITDRDLRSWCLNI